MKNYKNLTSYKGGIITLLSMGLSLLSMSFVNVSEGTSNYQILNSKISLSGSGKFNNWKMSVNSFKCSGKFTADNEGLEDVSELSFNLPIAPLKESAQSGGDMEEAFKKYDCNELVFTQKRVMILPIMKMVHMIGEVKMLTGTHATSMQIQYILNPDQSITLKGKQVFFLSEFGINLPNVKPGSIEDEISIHLDVQLIKQQQMIAKRSN